jgi:tetratricopeptide (TPR) repeat protein
VLDLEGDAKGSRAQFDKALEVFQKLSAEDPHNIQYRIDAIAASGLVANSLIEQDNIGEAIAKLQSTLAQARELPDGTERTTAVAINEFRMGKAHLHAAMGHRADSRQEYGEAKSWYELALPGLEEAQRKKTIESRDAMMIPEAREALKKCEAELRSYE